jgi:hypothetical protein
VFASATLAAVGAGACGGSKKPDTNTNTNTVVQPARDDAGVADAAEAPPVLEERHHSRNPNNTPMPRSMRRSMQRSRWTPRRTPR